MVLVRRLLSSAANGHEFWSHPVESRFHPKIRLFSGSISLIFSQYSTLHFWTLSVAAWLLYHIFFYDVVLISAHSNTWPSDSPNFRSWSSLQIIHITPLKWHLDYLSPLLWRILPHWSDNWIAVFLSIYAVNLSQFVVARACFWTRLLRSCQLGDCFYHWHLLCQMCCHYFFRRASEYAFITFNYKMIFYCYLFWR